jgi:hypothetical protein
MPRLSTIAVDSRGLAPPQWSAAWVQRRLVEAYSVERRLPAKRRPLLIASAWPSTVVEFSDLIGRADEARRQVFQSWLEYTRLGVSAEDISRMEQAHDWLAILAPYPEERLCLAQWAAAVAYRRPVSRLLLQRRWSKPTFYRRITAGAHVIALELIRQGQPVL